MAILQASRRRDERSDSIDRTETSSQPPACKSEADAGSCALSSPPLRSPVGKLLSIGSMPGENKKSYITHRLDMPESQDRRSSIHGALNHALASPQKLFRRRRGSMGFTAASLEFCSMEDDDEDSLTNEDLTPLKKTPQKKKTKKTPKAPADESTPKIKVVKKKKKAEDGIYNVEAPQFDFSLEASKSPTSFKSGFLPSIERSASDSSFQSHQEEHDESKQVKLDDGKTHQTLPMKTTKTKSITRQSIIKPSSSASIEKPSSARSVDKPTSTRSEQTPSSACRPPLSPNKKSTFRPSKSALAQHLENPLVEGLSEVGTMSLNDEDGEKSTSRRRARSSSSSTKSSPSRTHSLPARRRRSVSSTRSTCTASTNQDEASVARSEADATRSPRTPLRRRARPTRTSKTSSDSRSLSLPSPRAARSSSNNSGRSTAPERSTSSMPKVRIPQSPRTQIRRSSRPKSPSSEHPHRPTGGGSEDTGSTTGQVGSSSHGHRTRSASVSGRRERSASPSSLRGAKARVRRSSSSPRNSVGGQLERLKSKKLGDDSSSIATKETQSSSTMDSSARDHKERERAGSRSTGSRAPVRSSLKERPPSSPSIRRYRHENKRFFLSTIEPAVESTSSNPLDSSLVLEDLVDNESMRRISSLSLHSAVDLPV